MENNEQIGLSWVVHYTVVQLVGVGTLGWWHNDVTSSFGEIPRQHTTEVHELVPLVIRLGIGVAGRVTSINGKVSAFAVITSWKWGENKISLTTL